MKYMFPILTIGKGDFPNKERLYIGNGSIPVQTTLGKEYKTILGINSSKLGKEDLPDMEKAMFPF